MSTALAEALDGKPSASERIRLKSPNDEDLEFVEARAFGSSTIPQDLSYDFLGPDEVTDSATSGVAPRADSAAGFEVVRNWEGVVTAVDHSVFYGAVRDTSDIVQVPEDELEIEFDSVAEGDRDLVREGAVFYFTVGNRRVRGGSREISTRIVFRRMPRWSLRDIERAESATTDLYEKLNPSRRAP